MSITFQGRVALVTGAICWLLSGDAAAVTGEAVNASAGQTMI